MQTPTALNARILRWEPTPYRTGGWFADHDRNRYLVRRLQPRSRTWALYLNGVRLAEGNDREALKRKADDHAQR